MKTVHFTSALILILLPLLLHAQAEPVAVIKGQQLTGVTVSDTGRIFTNFPQWRQGVENAVMEIDTTGNDHKPYPNKNWNRWKPGENPDNDLFVAVQSVVAFKEHLYVLDTRNPFFQGVKGAPVIFVFNLNTDTLERSYELSENSFHHDSYINDLRIDPKRNKAYFTDSGHPGLVILDLESGASTRILDAHPSTTAETDHLTIDSKAWSNTVHADGIALDADKDLLYYHALTGYTLYALPLGQLNEGNISAEELVIDLGKTPAPDGMITDAKGNLYMADLENHKIVYRTPEGTLRTLIKGPFVSWADTFSIHGNYLYYTNSKIHLAGADVSNMEFEIFKIPLP